MVYGEGAGNKLLRNILEPTGREIRNTGEIS
jgi:hypothetical protein